MVKVLLSSPLYVYKYKKYYDILMTNKYLPYQLIFIYLIKKCIELKNQNLLVKKPKKYLSTSYK